MKETNTIKMKYSLPKVSDNYAMYSTINIKPVDSNFTIKDNHSDIAESIFARLLQLALEALRDD